jgi:ATP-dependent helicase HrpB
LRFDPYSTDLPIKEVFEEVKKKLIEHSTLIVNAPAGAGKSTLLPLALLDESWLIGKKILMLEPRRLAARTIASRMSDLIGEGVGQSVGFRIRFENRVSSNTRIEVLTEGILTRMIHQDNSLEGVGLVIFDEFHERSIHADVALALCREAQQILRPDLRILIMSATLDMPQLTSLLEAPSVVSRGRQYPVEIFHIGEQDFMMLPEMTTRTIIKAVKKHSGDVLTFFPGQAEILKCEALLRKELQDFEIHPLYGQLNQSKQIAAIMPSRSGKRKIVLATSIAETSLTIEGVKIVIDTGYGRTSKFDAKSGLSRLETIQIDRDSADQRAGRAGRLSPGVCYRMWSMATQHRLPAHRNPEIMEADLASLTLDMAQWGIVDPSKLTWLTQPPKGALTQASELLHQLEALENGRITEQGKKIHRLPCHPRIAHMLLMAENADMLGLATDIAPLLEERDPLEKEAGTDINTRIEVLRKHRADNRLGKNMSRIEKIASSYRKLFELEINNDSIDAYETGILLAHAFPERIACARPGNNAQFQLSNGKLAMLGHRDDLAHEPWLAIAQVDARDGMGKIFMASPLNPKDLAKMVKEKEVITWDTRLGGLIATKELRIGNIILQSKPLPEPNEDHLIDAISEALKTEGESLLNFTDEVRQWQYRVLSLRKWNPTDGWPDVSTSILLIQNSTWLKPYLKGIKKPEELKKINLKEAIQYHIDWNQQSKLNEQAPIKIRVSSGSEIPLQYFEDGSVPVLPVRLQEVFGLSQTPQINNGKITVLMHLLSPGFKPVQVTSDLRIFWDNTYFEVKKELKRRYPKHVWPDDPWKEDAISGVKKKK